MVEILEQGTKARGEILLRKNRRGWNKEIVAPPKGQTPKQWLQEAREAELRAAGQAAIAAEDAQIERAVLAAGAGVIAVQDEKTGRAQVFVHPAALSDTPSTKAPRRQTTETPGDAVTGRPPQGTGTGSIGPAPTLNPTPPNHPTMH